MKQFYYIKNESQLVGGISELFLIVGKQHFSFAIRNSNEIICSAYYETAEGDNWKLKLAEFHPELLHRFEKITVAFDVPEMAIIPNSLFDESALKMHLQTLHPITQNVVLYFDSIQNKEVQIGYAVAKELHDWVNEKYPSAICFHLTGSLLKNFKSTDKDSLLVDFRSGEFLVIVFKKEQLQLVQYYSFSSLADILYYLLKICEQFGLSQEEVIINISGLIEKDSAIYQELYKYFLNIEFEKNAESLNFVEAFNELPDYYFSNISKIITCAS